MTGSIIDYALAADRIIGSGEPSFETFRACTETFEKAVASRAYLASLHDLVRRMGEGTTDITPDISSGPFVVLYSSAVTTWAILLHRNANRSLYLNPTYAMSAPIVGTAIAASLYEIDRPFDFSVMDPAARLVRRSLDPHMDSGIVLKNGRSQALDICPAGDALAFTLRVNSAAFGAFEWSFDRATGHPRRVTSLSNVHSNLESIFDLLAAVGSPTSIGFIEPYLAHAAHHVRWKAVQTIGQLAPDLRYGVVKAAANDPHPHVRQAAADTLQRLTN